MLLRTFVTNIPIVSWNQRDIITGWEDSVRASGVFSLLYSQYLKCEMPRANAWLTYVVLWCSVYWRHVLFRSLKHSGNNTQTYTPEFQKYVSLLVDPFRLRKTTTIPHLLRRVFCRPCRNLALSSSGQPWRWKLLVHLKCCYLSTKLHDVISRKHVRRNSFAPNTVWGFILAPRCSRRSALHSSRWSVASALLPEFPSTRREGDFPAGR